MCCEVMGLDHEPFVTTIIPNEKQTFFLGQSEMVHTAT